MLTKVLRQNTEANRFIRLMLVFVLLFAALHVALHDLDVSTAGLESDVECQVCRLNHVPTVAVVVDSPFIPLQFLASDLPVREFEYQLRLRFRNQAVRAPPVLS